MNCLEDCDACACSTLGDPSASIAVASAAGRLRGSVAVGVRYALMLHALDEVERVVAGACDAEVLADVVSGARLVARRLAAVRRAARRRSSLTTPDRSGTCRTAP